MTNPSPVPNPGPTTFIAELADTSINISKKRESTGNTPKPLSPERLHDPAVVAKLPNTPSALEHEVAEKRLGEK